MSKFIKKEDGYEIEIEVENFGQVISKPTDIKIEFVDDDKNVELVKSIVPTLKPFQKKKITLLPDEKLKWELSIM